MCMCVCVTQRERERVCTHARRSKMICTWSPLPCKRVVEESFSLFQKKWKREESGTICQGSLRPPSGLKICWEDLENSENRYDHKVYYSSVPFSCSVVSDSLPPHALPHARPPCSSPTHGVYSSSCPSSH